MKISRRHILMGATSVGVLSKFSPASAWFPHGYYVPIPANVWMEAPDILAFYVDDAPIIKGNTITLGSPSAQAYDIAFQHTNPLTGNNEWCWVVGPAKTTVRFSDLPCPSYVNKVDLHNLSNYAITGGPSITAVYYRDECLDQGENASSAVTSSGTALLEQFRHTVYLKLSSPLSNGVTYKISNSASSNPFAPFSFTYNDKKMRAGGLKVSQVGVRADDTFKKAYLCSRVPGAPSSGVIDFAGTYGITTAQIINGAGATVATVNVNLRVAWNAMETGDFFASTGLDIADVGVGYAVTGIEKASVSAGHPIVTCPGHGFSTNDKCRFHGISGMIQIEGALIPPGAPGYWVAPTVTVIDANSFSINIDTSAFTAFSTTPEFSTALGGVSNVVYKCFNTNRAGTNVYGIDLSAFTTAGIYYIYIPGYGISDSFYMGTEANAVACGNIHQGIFNLRLGCDVNSSPGWNRPLANVDGVNGWATYQSLLPGMFSSEGAFKITPAGGTAATSGTGAYSNEGTLVLSSVTWLSGTATGTTTVPHGIPIGSFSFMNIIGCSPAGYNSVNVVVTSTGASTITYPVASNPGASPATTPGIVRSGFVTSTRVTGARASTQDAGDNDDLTCDHFYAYQQLAWVFNNIANSASRFTNFAVPLSTSLLDPTLYAGTNSLPPLFHEICWYADNYRVLQDANGQVPGGYGYGHFSSQVPNYPEAIFQYRGTDAGGNLTGQTVNSFMYAADHYGTMQYAALAAQIALICQGYGLTTLTSTWQASAIAAYNRAHDLMSNLTIRDAYYVSQLNLPTKMGWTTAQYNDAMGQLTARAVIQQHAADGAIYRLLGKIAGQTPYGDVIENKTLSGNPSIGTGSGGAGYAVGDLIILAGGTLISGGAPAIVRVSAVSVGVITSVVAYFPGEYSVAPGTPVAQASTTGSGTGASFGTATFLPTYNIAASENPNTGNYDYVVTAGATAAATYLLTHSNGSAAANSAFYTSSATCFNLMYATTLQAASNDPFNPLQNLIAHMLYVFSSGASPASSAYLQSMSAHIQWIGGANFVGKSMTARIGNRSVNALLHNDQFAMGVSVPPGIVPLSWNAYAVGSNLAFNGTGVNTDALLTYVADNITGNWEGNLQKGSTKMWNAWRFGESYWEYQVEQRSANDNVAEYTLATLVQTAALALYCHGWDGNV